MKNNPTNIKLNPIPNPIPPVVTKSKIVKGKNSRNIDTNSIPINFKDWTMYFIVSPPYVCKIMLFEESFTIIFDGVS